ncbi:MAG: glycosyltransferase involved in cell wall biosynthesis [Planctomycetota bacterium]
MGRPILAYDFSVLENTPWTGVERYALAMLRHLPQAMPDVELVAIWRRPSDPELTELTQNWTNEIDHSSLPRSLWRRFILPRLVRRSGATMLVAPVAHVPEMRGITSCRTIHDLPSPELLSIENSSWIDSGKSGRWKRFDLPTIFPSAATQTSFENLLPTAKAPRAVIHHGLDERWPQFESCPDAPPSLRLLVVGTVRERRMPKVLHDALLTLRQKEPAAELRWIGRADLDVTPYPFIDFLGELNDDEKIKEFQDATILICPSLIEGFGLPMLEGLAAGLTVVAADHPTSREIGASFPHFYDGHSSNDLLRAISEARASIPSNPAKQPQIKYARQFSWQKSARQHANFFRLIHNKQ